MKVGIVGTGLAGATADCAQIMCGMGREIMLFDKAVKRAQTRKVP